MSDESTINFSKPVALFPLPNVVLLPHATLPLHIFEQRYRHMIADALEGSRLIAMANFEGDSWRSNYEGNPPLRPHVCVGYIIRHHELDDGRYNILLQGLARARIIDEVHHEPYRLAQLESVEGDDVMEIDLTQERQQLADLITDPLLNELASVNALQNWFSDMVPTAALVDLTLMAVMESMEDRYRMLAEPDIYTRLNRLTSLLDEMKRTVAAANRLGPSTDDQGRCLN